jgi:hypothetical protein
MECSNPRDAHLLPPDTGSGQPVEDGIPETGDADWIGVHPPLLRVMTVRVK